MPMPLTRKPASFSGPVAASERLHTLNTLRGVARFGMLLVHSHQRPQPESAAGAVSRRINNSRTSWV